MGSCCSKREEKIDAEKTKQLANQGGITSQEIPKLIQFISNYFTQCNLFILIFHTVPDNEIIVLNIQKDQLKTYVAQLDKIIRIIREKTLKVMVPISIQASPMNTDTEMVIIMRTITNLKEIYFMD